jgi:nitrate reductase assembly molybdenum cofactor insertion protein NarJ
MQTLTHYAALALLFDYPAADYPARVAVVREQLGDRYPLSSAQLAEFARALPAAAGFFAPAALDEIQELFTRSFDVQPITTLQRRLPAVRR